MLKRFGELIARLLGAHEFDFAHLHGDEYAAQHDDPVKLQEFLEALRAEANQLRIKSPSGKGRVDGVGFSHGIGTDFDAADGALNANKAERTARGERGDAVNERRIQLGGADDYAARRDALDKGRDADSRGARPAPSSGAEEKPQPLSQAYGGAEGSRAVDDVLFQPAWHGSPWNHDRFSLAPAALRRLSPP